MVEQVGPAQAIVVDMINSQFDDLEERARRIVRERTVERAVGSLAAVAATENGSSPGKDNNGQQVPMTHQQSASEVLSRLSKMREAVSAVDRQLRTQVLASKPYESLDQQAEALLTASQAIERLRPMIKRTGLELNAMSGAISVEYLENVVSLSEKVRNVFAFLLSWCNCWILFCRCVMSGNR